tara:strand:- start:1760 stop:1951 length:192 start_codon:yes stop_codon:yes gene_type:complete
MAYVQKNNPIPKTGCGRRRMEQMSSPFNKISASCKAYAKRRYKVWPSAYASGFAVKSQKAGKC